MLSSSRPSTEPTVWAGANGSNHVAAPMPVEAVARNLLRFIFIFYSFSVDARAEWFGGFERTLSDPVKTSELQPQRKLQLPSRCRGTRDFSCQRVDRTACIQKHG